MPTSAHIKAALEPEEIYLLTVVSPRKEEGNSPTGIVGRCLARQLLSQGHKVRVLAEPSQCDGWPDAVSVIEGSITQPVKYAHAFDNVNAMFLAGAIPSTVDDVLARAREAGVEKIVLLSSHGPEYEEDNPPETWFWLAIENAVERSHLAWTCIRPSAVMGALIEGTYPATGTDWPDTIRAEGIVREALLNQGHYPFIHEDDLAAVAAKALTSDDYVGTILEAIGMPLSTRSRIHSIAKALDRSLDAAELTPEQSRSTWRRRGWPAGAIDVTLYALEEYGARLDEMTTWTLAQQPSVPDIIGRPLRTYDEWVSENIETFR
ncbi:MAG: NAD(P)H-binding protein [Corynebacteriales bacterium]|nr:NAD(P)H-binding protein [Mycobacteriales bacterium]